MKLSKAAKRFFTGYVLLQLMGVALFVWLLSLIANSQLERQAATQMESMAKMLRTRVNESPNRFYDPDLQRYLKDLSKDTGVRYSLFDGSGQLICDSLVDIDVDEVQENRPEIRQARKEGVGFSHRTSEAMESPRLFLAISDRQLDSDPIRGIVRVSITQDGMASTVWYLQQYLGLIVIGMSFVTGLLLLSHLRKTMEPLSEFTEIAKNIENGLYERIPSLRSQEDGWGELADAFTQMQTVLASRESGLKENSSRLEAVLSSMIEGVIAIDHSGTVKLANGAACRMLSLAQPELVGRKLMDIARLPELNEAVSQTLSRRIYSTTEFTTLGEPRKTLSAQVSILSAESKPGAAIVMHDVTELRQLETMRRDFVANVSHELKTPLASIRAYAETLKLGALNDSENNMQFVERIEDQADILNRQIQDLIQLARVESAQMSFEIVEVDLGDLGAECVQSFASMAQKRKIEVVFEGDGQEILAKADLGSVKTILNNLISNAIHYTAEGGTVTVSTSQTERQSTIEVKDTGIGISPEHQARIFERFYRVDKACSRDMGGTGLGLSIVKHLAQAFGGNVELSSELGKGSVFSVHLPRVDV